MHALHIASKRLPAEYAFSGHTAASLFGLELVRSELVEATIPREVPIRARAGMRLRRAFLPQSDVITHRGFRVTSRLRTVRDLGSGPDLVEAVVAVDMALRAGLVRLHELQTFVQEHPGARGINRLRRALRYTDARAESPMESRLRTHLVLAGLPMPRAQADLHDSQGGFLGRVDLFYPDRRLVIEYDGENHRDRLAADVRRQNAIVNAGFHILRFAAADLRKPDLIVMRVREARAALPKVPT